MRHAGTMSLGLPPFTRAVKWIIGIATSLFFLRLILDIGSPGAANLLLQLTALIPVDVAHGQIWRLLTYGFLPLGILELIFGLVIGVWMLGSQIEMDFGTRKFVEFYLWCLVGAGLFTTAVTYTRAFGMSPEMGLHALSGPTVGIFLAYGMLYPNRELILFPIPISIKAKYLVGISIVITFAIALSAAGRGGGAVVGSMPTLGGLLSCFLYIRFVPRGGLRYIFSERYYGMRNSYYRWKRRRAARKFEVYMRQHKREDYFDQYGNYKDPSQRKDDKNNGDSRDGWVN